MQAATERPKRAGSARPLLPGHRDLLRPVGASSPSRAWLPNPPAARVALLLDAENVGSRFAGGALEVARSEGEVVVAKAYGPVSVIGSKSWGPVLQHEGIDSRICTGCRKGKNSVDMHIAVDAMQMVLKLGIDVLVVVSSDSDFAPLATRVRQLGKRYHGIGVEGPRNVYPSLCSAWTELARVDKAASRLGLAMSERVERASRESGIEEDVLVDVVECVQARCVKQEWVYVSQLGNDIRAIRPGFTAKACGCKSLTGVLGRSNLFELESQGGVRMVRLKVA